MKYYIIAGEASGDLHGSNLIKALKQNDPEASFRMWGGDLMKAAANNTALTKHYRDLAFMGFIEVLKNIRTIFKNIRFCKSDIAQFNPDALILIDYPGFNLRIAKWAHQRQFKVYYYISPQVWAWHTSRVHKIKKFIHKMFVILPFEKEFYNKFNYQVDFVGHPLLDAIHHFPFNPDFRTQHNLPDKPIVALLPGSRKQEIDNMLQIMLSVVPLFPEYHFVIAGAASINPEYYHAILQASNHANLSMVNNQTYDLLHQAHAALVTSGTATLETALFEVPQVVCYKGSPVSFFIAKRLVDIKYIALVNLIVNQPLVKELIQNDLNTANLKTALDLILEDGRRNEIKKGYQHLKQLLGTSGASKRTAQLLQEDLMKLTNSKSIN